MVGRRLLGLSVGARAVHAVLLAHDTIAWAGRASYATLPELAEVVARLAGESGCPVRRARVVLERDVVQLRTITPAPPLKPRALRQYVALEAPRLFRKNGAPLATDGISVPMESGTAALWAAAAPEPLLSAILKGTGQAGLAVEGLGPAADVLPRALAGPVPMGDLAFPDHDTTELLTVGPRGSWHSRLMASPLTPLPSGEGNERWVAALAALGTDASRFAAAYAGAVALPRLELWPAAARAVRVRDARRQLLRLAVAGLACWTLAGALYVGRLLSTLHSSTQYLDAVTPSLDSALAARRELDAGRATLATMANAEFTRSRHLALLAAVTASLGDSAYLAAYQVGADGAVRLAGYAASAPQVLARLSRLLELRDPQFEGPVTREVTAGNRALDRFAIVATREDRP